jgi:hypothetical protein
MKVPNSELIYRQLLAAGVAVDAALAVVAVLKTKRVEEQEGHWVTIEGRPVFIRGPWPELELPSIEREDGSINYQAVLRDGKAVEKALMQRNPALAKTLRRYDRLRRQREEVARQAEELGSKTIQFVIEHGQSHPVAQEMSKQWFQLWDQRKELDKQLQEIQERLFKLDGEFAAALGSTLGKIQPANFEGHIKENIINISEAKAWISLVVGKVSDTPCVIKQLGPGEGYFGGSRSYFVPKENTMYLIKNESTWVVIHEWGHYLENQRPAVHQACVEFLNRRYQEAVRSGNSEKADIKPLKELTSIGAYEPYEVAFRDRFRDPYVGKVYRDASNTEVMSMGLQYLYENPLRFRSEDPEHYYLTLGLIAHVRKNPVDKAKRVSPTSTGPWAKV